MGQKFVVIDPENDTVATALEDLPKGATLKVLVRGKAEEITLKKAIPYGHKFAIVPMPGGSEVVKYGHSIGVVKGNKNLLPGDFVHTREMRSNYHRVEFV